MYDEGIFAMFAVFGVLMVILLIVGVALYVIGSLGLYKLASNAGIDNPWLAWIPIGNLYIMAKLVKSVNIGSYNVPRLELVLPIGAAAVMVLSAIPVIGTLISIAFMVLVFFVLYRLYSIYRPNQAVLWLVLSIVLGFMTPIFLFIMRNDRPVNPA